MPIKLTVIGGGSSSFVPALVRKLISSERAQRRPADADGRQRAAGAHDGGARAQARRELGQPAAGHRDARPSRVAARCRLCDHDDRRRRHGRLGEDIEIPAKYGIVMHVADSIGPGGIMRALRNAPVIAAVARDVAEVAPDALVFNYANPASVEAMALQTVPTVRSLSLCSCTRAARHTPAGWRDYVGRRARRDRDAGRGGRHQPLRERGRASV